MRLQLESVDCIAQAAAHNAFTDLIYFDQQWWCGYRAASHHMSFDGILRVLVSDDGLTWSENYHLNWAGGDLRDPKFVIDSKGQLLLLCGLRQAVYSKAQEKTASISWKFCKETDAFECLAFSPATWRWSATLIGSKLYSPAYGRQDLLGTLYVSEDTKAWTPHCHPFFPKTDCFCNEASIAYDSMQQTAYCLLRRDGEDCVGMLGQAKAPFLEWRWTQLDRAIGGPKLIILSSGELLAGFRVIENETAKTVLAKLSQDKENLEVLLTLPSDGDCSYPGLVELGGKLYVSYYSSHQADQANVYFAKLNLVR